ncbi:MAG: hypothetical protein QXG05_05665 [Nitrososphaerota archaeon]
MKAKAGLAAGAILLAAGLLTVAYFSTQLSSQEVIFEQSSVPIGSYRYLGYEIGIDFGGKYHPIIKGWVGSVGCCVDFYVVDNTNWISWSVNPLSRDALSTVHINSTVVSSQSPQGQFSFVPSSPSYSVVFVNDEYPNATSTQNVHATIMLDYTPFASLYALGGGLAVAVIGVCLLLISLRRRASQPTCPESTTSRKRPDAAAFPAPLVAYNA